MFKKLLLLKAGEGVQHTYDFIRKKVKPFKEDKVFHVDIEIILNMLKDSSLLSYVEEKIGPLY